MNTKKEAKELVDKFHNELDYEIEGYKDILKRVAKQCALICADEMIKEISVWKGSYMGNKRYKELLEVKQEIEKL